MKFGVLLALTWAPFAVCLMSVEDLLREQDKCNSLHYTCSNGEQNIYCKCDSMCLYYDDCCFDAEEHIIGKHESKKNLFIERSTCEFIDFSRFGKHMIGAFMVSKCEESWKDEEIKRKCMNSDNSDPIDITPVFDMKTKLTFKNKQCAICNNVINVIPWKLKISCSNNYYDSIVERLSFSETITNKINSSFCSHSFVPTKEHSVRYCLPHLQYLTGQYPRKTHNESCKERSMSPVIIYTHPKFGTLMFRNVHCAIEEMDIEILLMNCYPNFNRTLTADTRTGTLSSLIDITPLFRKRKTIQTCSETEIYLSDQVGCQHLYCPFHLEPCYGACVDIKQGIVQMFDLLFEVNSTMRSWDLFRFKEIISEITAKVDHIDTLMLQSNITIGNDVISGSKCSIVRTRNPVKFKSGYNMVTRETQRHFLSKILFNFSEMIDDLGLVTHINNVEKTSCKSNNFISNPKFIADIYSSETDLPCPAVKVEKKGFRHYGGHTSVTGFDGYGLHINGVVILPTDTIQKHGHLYICVETFTSNYAQKGINYISGYRLLINRVCACISIICLICCLTQYFVIPFLRNEKSHLMIVLICFLLLAQSCLLLTYQFSFGVEFCKWFGMIHHFAWLGSFMFMFLCSFRLNMDLRRLYVSRRNGRTMSTVMYCLIGFIITFVIVLGTKLTNVNLDGSSEWYGGSVCFLSKTLALLVAFVIPVSLILCGNLVIFLMLIHYIASTSMVHVSGFNKSNVLIYAKISTSMGLSWILGIIAVTTEFEVTLAIFEIIASLQGAFLMLNVVSNDRVKRFYTGMIMQRLQRFVKSKPDSNVITISK